MQLINETSHRLNLSLRLSDTIGYMIHEIIRSFEAEEIGFMMCMDTNWLMLEESTAFFHEDGWQSCFEHYIDKVKKTNDAIYVGNTEENHPSLKRFKSVLIIPMVQNNELKGIVFILHSCPYHFTFDEFRLLQSLIHHSTLAFTNSMLHEELERLVKTDYLTKLYTRNYLDQRIGKSMKEDHRGAFCLLDIDNFKSINDHYGHQIGDETIVNVANIVKKCIRDKGIVARWGGEELAVYLPNMNIDNGKIIAELIVELVANETTPKVTVSIGVSEWCSCHQEQSLVRLFNIADEGLYEAKELGKNRVVAKSAQD